MFKIWGRKDGSNVIKVTWCLGEIGVGFHLASVKGPVMDRLRKTHLPEELNGRVFLSQYEAFRQLTGRSAPSVVA